MYKQYLSTITLTDLFVLMLAPSGAPVIISAEAISSQEILVLWQPLSPETLNGKLQKYQIRLKKMNMQPTTIHTPMLSHLLSTQVPTTPSSSGNPVTELHEPNSESGRRRELQFGGAVVIDAGLNQSYHIGQLEKWTMYEVQVRAVTVAPGPYSGKVVVKTKADGKYMTVWFNVLMKKKNQLIGSSCANLRAFNRVGLKVIVTKLDLF